jgi:hypothetical protein
VKRAPPPLQRNSELEIVFVFFLVIVLKTGNDVAAISVSESPHSTDPGVRPLSLVTVNRYFRDSTRLDLN